MRISFFGAAREVTGSNILVETSGKKILLECGLFQGYKLAEERNYAPFAFKASEIDFVIVCHAHLDHVGRIPKLIKEGFRGKIFSTAPTRELAELVMEDNAKLMGEEAERENHPPLYNKDQITKAMELFETIVYGEDLEICKGVKIKFMNAGHILGSAFLILKSEGKTLAYSSDLGNTPSVLLKPLENLDFADFIICESTYGSREHEDASKRADKLRLIINSTILENGVLMIPSFAIERTQELLHDIEHYCDIANSSLPTFYLDSPLAVKVTKVFGKYEEFLNTKIVNDHSDHDIFGLSRIKLTSTVEESKEINTSKNPKIIIAGAGMLNGGRILFHLQRYIEDERNSLLIVGYQAKGTLGRKLLDGEKEIKIFGKKYEVGANVTAISSYSAHADSKQLVKWIIHPKGVKKVFLVHGETEESLALSRVLEDKMKVEVSVPQQGETYDL